MPELETWEDRLNRQIAAYHDAALLYAAVRLGLPDRLATQAHSPQQLAEELGLSAPHLERFLHGLVTLGVCAKRPDGCFALTPEGQALRAGERLNEKVQIVVGQYWRPWAELVSTLQTGKPAFAQVFGADVRDWRRDNPEQGALFESYLAKERLAQSNAIAEVLDLSKAQTVVNVGGDNLNTLPAGADLYVLTGVLQNFDDAEAAVILTRCRQAMKEAAKLVLVERLMPEKAADDTAAVMLDLHMMVITGGCVRSRAEMETLLAQAGLALTQAAATRSGLTVLTAVRRSARSSP